MCRRRWFDDGKKVICCLLMLCFRDITKSRSVNSFSLETIPTDAQVLGLILTLMDANMVPPRIPRVLAMLEILVT